MLKLNHIDLLFYRNLSFYILFFFRFVHHFLSPFGPAVTLVVFFFSSFSYQIITLSLCANRPFLPFDILSEPSPPRLCCRLYRFNSLICSYYPARGSGTPPRPAVYHTYLFGRIVYRLLDLLASAFGWPFVLFSFF